RMVRDGDARTERGHGLEDEMPAQPDRLLEREIQLPRNVSPVSRLRDGGELHVVAARRISEVVGPGGACEHERGWAAEILDQPRGDGNRAPNVTQPIGIVTVEKEAHSVRPTPSTGSPPAESIAGVGEGGARIEAHLIHRPRRLGQSGKTLS